MASPSVYVGGGYGYGTGAEGSMASPRPGDTLHAVAKPRAIVVRSSGHGATMPCPQVTVPQCHGDMAWCHNAMVIWRGLVELCAE